VTPNKSKPAAPAKPAASSSSRAAAAKAAAPVKKKAAPASKAAPAKKAAPAQQITAATPAAPAPVAEADKARPKPKQKLVRDSFTIPKNEYLVLEALKSRALSLTQAVKKSELLRAGIAALDALNDAAFLKALDAVPSLKTGRPRRDPPPPAPADGG